jgi:hypothetical protein
VAAFCGINIESLHSSSRDLENILETFHVKDISAGWNKQLQQPEISRSLPVLHLLLIISSLITFNTPNIFP